MMFGFLSPTDWTANLYHQSFFSVILTMSQVKLTPLQKCLHVNSMCLL